MLIFCPSCRTVVAPYWKTCRYCGERVDRVPASREPPQVPLFVAPPPKLEEPESERLSRDDVIRHVLSSMAGAAAKVRRARVTFAAGALPQLRRMPPWYAAVAGVAGAALMFVVMTAARTGDASLFSPKDTYLAAFELLATPTQQTKPAATPVATQTAGAITPTDEATATEVGATPADAPVSSEDAGGGNNGRGRGRGRND